MKKLVQTLFFFVLLILFSINLLAQHDKNKQTEYEKSQKTEKSLKPTLFPQ